MFSAIGRAAIRRSGLRSTDAVARLAWQFQRVCVIEGRVPQSNITTFSSQLPGRLYATAASTTSTAKPRAKKAVSKKTAKKRTAKKAAKPKKPKKELTEKQIAARAEKKAKTELKQLKETALLVEPKGLPSTAWQVLVAEGLKNRKSELGKGGVPIGTIVSELAREYKSMDAGARERYNHVANQNKEANENAYRRWVESFTPEQVRQANLARLRLRRKDPKATTYKYSPIQDPRQPKKARNARVIFLTERYASGDMKGIPLTEAANTIQREWDALSAAEKQQFQTLADQEKQQYAQNFRAVFHREYLPYNGGHAAAASAHA